MIVLKFDKQNANKATFFSSPGVEIRPILYSGEIYYLQPDLKSEVINHDTTIVFTEEDLTMPPPWPSVL